MNTLANIIALTIVFAVPLMLVALGGMYSEHSGVINIALEGIMIIGALFSCFALSALDKSGFGKVHPQLSMLLAIIIAGVSGCVFSLLLAFAAINLRADQTIGGTALNIFAPAFAVVFTWAVQGQGLTTIQIPTWVRITQESLGLKPFTGFWNNLIFKYFYITTPIAVVLFIAAWLLMYKTKFGLRLRACGEHPQAAASVGISVYKMRWSGVLISGVFGALGGISYILAGVSEWKFENGVAGFGFLSLAVMIFGQWKPFRIALAALLFGLFRALSNVYIGINFLNALNIPSTVYNMMPYIISLLVLAFTSKSSKAPKAEGIPYDKGQR